MRQGERTILHLLEQREIGDELPGRLRHQQALLQHRRSARHQTLHLGEPDFLIVDGADGRACDGRRIEPDQRRRARNGRRRAAIRSHDRRRRSRARHQRRHRDRCNPAGDFDVPGHVFFSNQALTSLLRAEAAYHAIESCSHRCRIFLAGRRCRAQRRFTHRAKVCPGYSNRATRVAYYMAVKMRHSSARVLL